MMEYGIYGLLLSPSTFVFSISLYEKSSAVEICEGLIIYMKAVLHSIHVKHGTSFKVISTSYVFERVICENGKTRNCVLCKDQQIH